MIKQEIVTAKNGQEFRHTWSDANKYILREDGAKYSATYDVMSSTHTYTESDEDIPKDKE